MRTKHKKSSSRRKDPYLGKKVTAIPLTREASAWLKRHAAKGEDWMVVTLFKREGEYLTLVAGDRTVKLFGPHDMTWSPIETTETKTERLIKLTAGVIADWVAPRDKLLAEAIRRDLWRKNPPVSSDYLTLDAVEGPPAERAKRRPKNFESLPPEQQWDIDKKLGILDWDGR